MSDEIKKLTRYSLSIVTSVLLLFVYGYSIQGEAQEARHWVQGEAQVAPHWDLTEFSEVVNPNELGFTENLIWGAKVILNHPDVRELVPIYAYNWHDVCETNNLGVVTEPEYGVLYFQVEVPSGSEIQTYLASGEAVWENSLQDACNIETIRHQLEGSTSVARWNVGALSNTWETGAAEVAGWLAIAPLTNAADNPADNNSVVPRNFILTIDELPDVNLAHERLWWMCNDNVRPSPNSVCDQTFALSPYPQHRSLRDASVGSVPN